MPPSLSDSTTPRAIRAPGASTDPERLRAAYLGVLKLALCDLTGTSTISVGRLENRVFSREIDGEQLALRTNGMDWPLSGVTMSGLVRLDDLQTCIESVVADEVPGDLIEAGAWRGGASILARATLDSLGADDRTLVVADSFQGFPSAPGEHPANEELELFEFLSAPLAEVQANFERFGYGEGVEFIPGFFAETLPALSGRQWSIVRLDGDSYDATTLSLDLLYPHLSVGGYVILDDYGAVEECAQAVEDFRSRHEIEETIDTVDWTCRRWRRETENGPPAKEPEEPGEEPASARAARTAPPRERRDVPSLREVELEEELGKLRSEMQLLLERPETRARVKLAALAGRVRKGGAS